MKALIFLALLIGGYVFVYKKGYHEFTLREHVYSGIFVVGYLIVYYLLSYQKQFVYKLLTNVKHTDRFSKYDIQDLSVRDYEHPQKKQVTVDPMNLKYLLGTKQNWRCMTCSNPILQKDIHNYKLHFITPLQYGGENDINNLGVLCQTCSMFSPF